MSKVIFFTHPHAGHINPNIGLITELNRRGEEVICLSLDTYKDIIINTGSLYHAYDEDVCELLKPPDKGENFKNIDDRILDIFSMFDYWLDICMKYASKFHDLVYKEHPDYIIYDFVAGWGKLLANKFNLKSICCNEVFAFPKNLMDINLNDFLKYTFGIPENLLLDIDHYRIKKMVSKCSKLLSSKYGLNADNLFNFIYSNDLNIVYITSDFNPYSEYLDNNFIFIGYDIKNLNNVVELPYAYPEKRPLIYITQGSVHYRSHENFFYKCIEAFSNANVNVLISAGSSNNLEIFNNNLSDNIIIKNNVKQIDVLRNSSLFITHGGSSGVREAICCYVPMIVTNDDVIADMVKKFGIGLTIPYFDVTSEEIRSISEQILNDTRYYTNCRKLGDSFKLSGGNKYAADAIFRLKA